MKSEMKPIRETIPLEEARQLIAEACDPLTRTELVRLLDMHRRNDGRYDCLVPGSGGKDSAYQAHVLKTRYRMHPLTCTWPPTIAVVICGNPA